MNKNILISICISIALIGGTFYIITQEPSSVVSDSGAAGSNVEVRDGVQYVTVSAQNGYAPRTSVIEPDLPTKLVVKTNGTYDCSASLVIREVGYQKILEPTGQEIIDIGTPKSGDSLQGICGMGMFNFTVKTK